MSDCVFCKIVAREIPAHVVYEDGAALAFLDVHPLSPGHTVVVPKEHAATLLEVRDPDLGALFAAVKKVAEMLLTRLQADGLTIGINHGRASGQAVEHLHIHLLPRFHGDGGGSLHSVVQNPPKESLHDIAKRIRGE
jgi:histidine triad (HIT) family protein